MKSNRVWNKIFPLKIGDIVKYKKKLSLGKLPADSHLGEIGIIDYYVEEGWKRDMVFKWGIYPEAILGEEMYAVEFPSKTGVEVAFRREELELIRDEDYV